MPSEPRPKKLLDTMRDALRAQHYALRTEQAYVDWARRYILFHHKRHPKEMGKPEIEAFLTHLAVERQVAASTQNQAASALLFLSACGAAAHRRTAYHPGTQTRASADGLDQE